MNKRKEQSSARKVAYMGMLLAVAITASFLESMVSSFFALPPGIKLGLANVIVMFTLFTMGWKHAAALNFLRSAFVFITRGAVAFLLSFTGGMLSLVVIFLLMRIKRWNISYLILSIVGAIFHNVGQIIMAYFILKNGYVFYYFPILLISAVFMGSLTSVILKAMYPYLNNIFQAKD